MCNARLIKITEFSDKLDIVRLPTGNMTFQIVHTYSMSSKIFCVDLFFLFLKILLLKSEAGLSPTCNKPHLGKSLKSSPSNVDTKESWPVLPVISQSEPLLHQSLGTLYYPWGYAEFYNSKFHGLANQIDGRIHVMLEYI